MFNKLKWIFFVVIATAYIGGCSTITTTLQLPISETSFRLPVENEDKILIGEFILLKSADGYLSLQVMNSIEEDKQYGLNTIQLINQLYGFDQPSNKDIALTKKAISDNTIEKSVLEHKYFFAMYLKEVGGRERIIFTPKDTDSLTYYILETQGKDAISFFNGVK